MSARDARSRYVLGAADLHRLFAVLEDAVAATGLCGFREQILESLGRHLGYRHTTFFVGPTLPQVFADERPIANGLAAPMVPSYVEEFHQDDPFAQPVAQGGYHGGTRPLSLGQLTSVTTAPRQRRYLETFLFRNGVRDKIVIPLVSREPFVGGVGLLSEGFFTARDCALAQLLARHLGHLLALHAHVSAPAVDEPPLSPRQREVADLVAHGLTNQQIADALCVSVDTVKKHVTSVLRVTGCASRTQLALARARQTIPS